MISSFDINLQQPDGRLSRDTHGKRNPRTQNTRNTTLVGSGFNGRLHKLLSSEEQKQTRSRTVRAGKELNQKFSNRQDNTHHECLIALNQLDRIRPLSRYRVRGSITTSRVLLPPPTAKCYPVLQEKEEPPQPSSNKPAIPIQTNKQRQHQ